MTSTRTSGLRVVQPGDRPPLYRDTARTLLSPGQKIIVGLVVLVLAADLYWFGLRHLLLILIGAAQVFYLAFVGLKLLLTAVSFGTTPQPESSRPEPVEAPADLPVITVLVPLFDETSRTLRGLVTSIKRLNYPKDRLQVIPLLEAVDTATIEALRSLRPPPYFEPIIVPDSLPRTKPKACAYGMAAARGDYTVIYDAEDRPDPDQLIKAVRAFRAAPPEVGCLQARLAFWNLDTNLITRMYWVEYTVHFEYILTGLARLKLVPPLGGTSNIFRTEVLRRIAIPAPALRAGGLDPAVMEAAWDPWNVTEDADIAAWLSRAGYRVEMIDSYTLEEASHRARTAVKQRARWGKGYAQSGLVHTRRPITVIRQMGLWRFLAYNLLMLGTPVSFMINPIFWAMTAAYFLTRSAFIESLFPATIFYVGIFTAIIGNFLLFYQLMVACLKREEYGNVKYMFLVPFWWAFTSYSMWKGAFELLTKRSRSHWHATKHGHESEESEALAIERHLAKASAGTS